MKEVRYGYSDPHCGVSALLGMRPHSGSVTMEALIRWRRFTADYP
jgi:hypothetical protein